MNIASIELKCIFSWCLCYILIYIHLAYICNFTRYRISIYPFCWLRHTNIYCIFLCSWTLLYLNQILFACLKLRIFSFFGKISINNPSIVCCVKNLEEITIIDIIAAKIEPVLSCYRCYICIIILLAFIPKRTIDNIICDLLFLIRNTYLYFIPGKSISLLNHNFIWFTSI